MSLRKNQAILLLLILLLVVVAITCSRVLMPEGQHTENIIDAASSTRSTFNESPSFTAVKDITSSFQCDLASEDFLSVYVHVTGFSVYEKTNHMGDPLPRWNRWWEGLEDNQYETDDLIISSGHCYYSLEALGIQSVRIVHNSSISSPMTTFSELRNYLKDEDAEVTGYLQEIKGVWHLAP